MDEIQLAKQVEENKKNIEKISSTFLSKTSTYILAGFGLVTALAWNDAIQSFFRLLFGQLTQEGIIAKFIYAMIVTGILVLISSGIDKK